MLKSVNFTSLPFFILYWLVLILIVMAPYIFGGRMIAPGADTVNYYYPAFAWYAEALKSGQSFLWNPTMLSGFPSYLSQVSGYIEPLNLILFSAIPSFLLAYHMRLAIDFLLVMLFSYLVARRWEISKLASFFVGPTFLMAFHWWYLSNTVIANTLFLIPFLMWVYSCARDSDVLWRRVLWGVLGGAGVGWVFLGGYAQIAAYALVFVGIYALCDFFVLTKRDNRTVRLAVYMSSVLGIFALVGFLVGSPQILAALAHTPLTVRSGGLSYALTQAKVLRLSEFIYFLVPDYLRIPLFNGGRKPLFIGFISMLLALVALGSWRKHRSAVPAAVLFLFAIITAVPYSPIFYALHKLPVFDLFRYPYRWMYLGIWAFAVLGAFGFDLMRHETGGKWPRVLAIGACAGAIGLSCLVFTATFVGEWFWGPVKQFVAWLFTVLFYSPEAFPKGYEHYVGAAFRSIDAWRSLVMLTNLYFTVAYISIVAATVVFTARTFGKLSTRVFELSVAGLILVTFIGVFAVRWPDSRPGEILWAAEDTTLAVMSEADRSLYRLVQFDPGRAFTTRHTNLIWNTEDTNAAVDLAHVLAVPNTNQYTGILLLDGYEPFITRDLLAVTALHFASTYTSQDELKNVTFEDRKEIFTSRLDVMGMMGGKYVMSGEPLQHPNLKEYTVVRGSSYDVPSNVYVNTLALPRVYLAQKTEAVPHTGVIDLIDAGYKFGTVAYLNCDDCATAGSKNSTFTISELENGYFNIAVDAKRDEWLIVSESYLPGWKAEIDGETIVPTLANGMYMGIPVPAGKHRVILQYEGIRGEARWLYKLGLFPRAPLGE